jgi:hypothetical protein
MSALKMDRAALAMLQESAMDSPSQLELATVLLGVLAVPGRRG